MTPIVINTWMGVKSVPRTLVEVGKSFSGSEAFIIRKIVLPYALPSIVTGLRLGMGRAVIAMAIAELFTALSGLGGLLLKRSEDYDTAGTFVPAFVFMAMGITAVDIYGLSEVMGPGVAAECVHRNGLHVFEDHFLIEILDPQTMKPVSDGEQGEVVFTTLTKEGIPVIRYRTRDISRIVPGECACGRTFRRMERVTGRTDDMLIIRGVNVYPSQIEQVLMSVDGVAPHYQVVLGKRGSMDTVEVQVEVGPEFAFDEIRELEALQRAVAGAIASALAVSVDVKLVEPRAIQRSEGKAKRVVDLRNEGV